MDNTWKQAVDTTLIVISLFKFFKSVIADWLMFVVALEG